MMLAMAGGNVIVPLFAAPATATNLAPTGAPNPAGYGAGAVGAPVSYGLGLGKVDDWNLIVEMTGANILARLWLYHAGLVNPADPGTVKHIWTPAGVGTDADKGKINGGAVIGVNHSERFAGLGPADGFHLQLISGTVTSVLAWLVGVGRRA